jgi:hypothetical protein
MNYVLGGGLSALALGWMYDRYRRNQNQLNQSREILSNVTIHGGADRHDSERAEMLNNCAQILNDWDNSDILTKIFVEPLSVEGLFEDESEDESEGESEEEHDEESKEQKIKTD